LPRPTAAAVALAAILAAGFGLRVWGVEHGLPAVYNLDEGAHFVKPAVRFFSEGYNPHYFQNPPLFSYILHLVFAFGYGGIWPRGAGNEIRQIFSTNPTELYTIGRVTAGLMGLGAATAIYFAGKKLFGVVAGLIAAALLALTYLPVYYGHLALNDSPTMLWVSLTILASVYIYRTGSWWAYVAGGAGLGMSVASKYTSLAVVFTIITAFALRAYNDRDAFKQELPRLFAAAGMSLLAFVVANPFSVLSPDEFAGQVRRQQKFSAEIPKLGLDDTTGWQYYMWTLTWGFGWAPLAAAVVGFGLLLKSNWQKAVLLIGFFVTFWFFMGMQERFYARWFLPVYPVLALYAGYAVQRAVEATPKRAWAYAVGIGLGALLVAQGVVTSIRSDQVHSRDDTRAQAHEFLRANLPAGERIVLEPIASKGFARESESLTAKHLWRTYPPPRGQVEDYQSALGKTTSKRGNKLFNPLTLEGYARREHCVVITGSTQYGRAAKEPDEVPGAIAYYDRLEREATLVKVFSPVREGEQLPAFNFDWSFDYYPSAYYRPGPEIRIYKLNNGACAKKKLFDSIQGDTQNGESARPESP
jgi:hypothetical protein